MEYKLNIQDVADMSEEIEEITFSSHTPADSTARSSNIWTTLTIKGKISFMQDKVFMRDSTKKIAEWSLVRPAEAETYKSVTLEYLHSDTPRKYEMPFAFVVSYKETFADIDGKFELVLRQKVDRLDSVTIG